MKCSLLHFCNEFHFSLKPSNIILINSGVIPIILLSYLNFRIIRTMNKTTFSHNKICTVQRWVVGRRISLSTSYYYQTEQHHDGPPHGDSPCPRHLPQPQGRHQHIRVLSGKLKHQIEDFKVLRRVRVVSYMQLFLLHDLEH